MQNQTQTTLDRAAAVRKIADLMIEGGQALLEDMQTASAKGRLDKALSDEQYLVLMANIVEALKTMQKLAAVKSLIGFDGVGDMVARAAEFVAAKNASH
jgi:hypothetical protein